LDLLPDINKPPVNKAILLGPAHYHGSPKYLKDIIGLCHHHDASS
jgi:hypothetical protein